MSPCSHSLSPILQARPPGHDCAHHFILASGCGAAAHSDLACPQEQQFIWPCFPSQIGHR